MKREDAIKALIECQNNSNTEEAHSDADNVLCDLLAVLGYGDVIEEYYKVIRWFS